jgi:DNA-binding transcriptional regulator YiaG
MPNLASALKTEVSRVARKVVRAETATLKAAISTHRAEIAALKRRTKALEQELRRLSKVSLKPPRSIADEAPSRAFRFSAKSFAAQRKRLALSAQDCGLLLGVSGQSIYKWEDGRASPRVPFGKAGRRREIPRAQAIDGRDDAGMRTEALQRGNAAPGRVVERPTSAAGVRRRARAAPIRIRTPVTSVGPGTGTRCDRASIAQTPGPSPSRRQSRSRGPRQPRGGAIVCSARSRYPSGTSRSSSACPEVARTLTCHAYSTTCARSGGGATAVKVAALAGNAGGRTAVARRRVSTTRNRQR